MRERLLLVLCCFASASVALAQDSSLQERLALAVDLPTPRERKAAAYELARDEEVTLEQWEEACRDFEPRGLPPSVEFLSMIHEDLFETEVDLQVLDQVERTELAIHVPPSYDPEEPHGLLLLLQRGKDLEQDREQRGLHQGADASGERPRS